MLSTCETKNKCENPLKLPQCKKMEKLKFKNLWGSGNRIIWNATTLLN